MVQMIPGGYKKKTNFGEKKIFYALQGVGGRPPRVWRIATPEEQILRKFADRDKVQVKRARLAPSMDRQEQLMKPPSLRMDAFAEEFSVEFEWSKTGKVVHDHLREREAYKLFEEFMFDVNENSGEPTLSGNLPVSAVLRDESGKEVRRQTF